MCTHTLGWDVCNLAIMKVSIEITLAHASCSGDDSGWSARSSMFRVSVWSPDSGRIRKSDIDMAVASCAAAADPIDTETQRPTDREKDTRGLLNCLATRPQIDFVLIDL